mgnify:CR=1 FL=1
MIPKYNGNCIKIPEAPLIDSCSAFKNDLKLECNKTEKPSMKKLRLFGVILKLINCKKENDFPDGISYFGYSFIYPDAVDNKEGYYSDPHYDYEKKLIDSGKTTKNQLKSIVYDMFKFKNRVPLNTLPHIWSRKVINRVDGELFRPPYPDHFALNAIFLKSNTWVFS